MKRGRPPFAGLFVFRLQAPQRIFLRALDWSLEAGVVLRWVRPNPDLRMTASAKSPAVPAISPTIADVFGPGGMIERCMPAGYEHRRSQLAMAELVDEAFRDKRHL